MIKYFQKNSINNRIKSYVTEKLFAKRKKRKSKRLGYNKPENNYDYLLQDILESEYKIYLYIINQTLENNDIRLFSTETSVLLKSEDEAKKRLFSLNQKLMENLIEVDYRAVKRSLLLKTINKQESLVDGLKALHFKASEKIDFFIKNRKGYDHRLISFLLDLGTYHIKEIDKLGDFKGDFKKAELEL